MGYNVIDLLNKCIDIEKNREKILKNIIDSAEDTIKIKIILKVFLKEIDRSINYYKQLNQSINDIDLEEIDFRTYDKISFLINEYNEKLDLMKYNNISVKDFLIDCLNLKKDKYALFLDIQGRLFNNNNKSNTRTYKILSEIIGHTGYEISALEKTIHTNKT